MREINCLPFVSLCVWYWPKWTNGINCSIQWIYTVLLFGNVGRKKYMCPSTNIIYYTSRNMTWFILCTIKSNLYKSRYYEPFGSTENGILFKQVHQTKQNDNYNKSPVRRISLFFSFILVGWFFMCFLSPYFHCCRFFMVFHSHVDSTNA